jgi:HNH endonuclease
MSGLDLPKRLEDKILTEPNSGCWLWIGSRFNTGYGQAWDGALKRLALAHRQVYEVLVGPIPEGKKLLHSCDNPCCVNPDHLSIGSQADNLADMRRKRRHAFGEKVGGVKLTADSVVAIRNAVGSHRKIGAEFGVCHTVVGDIKRREIWKHVED